MRLAGNVIVHRICQHFAVCNICHSTQVNFTLPVIDSSNYRAETLMINYGKYRAIDNGNINCCFDIIIYYAIGYSLFQLFQIKLYKKNHFHLICGIK